MPYKAMSKRNRSIQILCSIAIGIVFLFAVTVVLMLSGIFEIDRTKITISTKSVEALYDSSPLTNHEWKISRGEIKDGHNISVEFYGSQTNVGESPNYIEVTITDELGADVTSDYDVYYDLGILKVNPRVLVISSASDSKIFDGFVLENPNYAISSEHDGLVIGHSAIVNVTGSIIDIGEKPNTIESVFIYDRLGTDVTRNYNLFVREGTLKITSPYESSITPPFTSGSDLLPGPNSENAVLYSIYSELDDFAYLKMSSYGNYNGKAWSEAPVYDSLINDKYSAIYLISLLAQGKQKDINKVQIKSNYQPYALPYYTIPEKGNAEIQTNDVFFSGSISNAYTLSYLRIGSNYPSLNNNYKPLYKAFEAEYRKFVYENYLYIDDETREFMEGIIKKERFPKDTRYAIQLVSYYIRNAAKYEANYDKAMEQESNVAIAFLSKYKAGLCKHYASAATLLFRALGIPARYTIGAVADLKAGEWTNVLAKQAHAWVEVYIDGTGWVYVEVTGGGRPSDSAHDENCDCDICDPNDHPFSATLTPITVRQKYNGTTLKATNLLKGFEEFEALGYTYDAVVEGERTSAGISTSIIKSIKIYDKNNTDVTSMFDLELNTGIVHVYLYALNFISPSDAFEYCTKPVPVARHTSGVLAPDHTFVIESTVVADAGILPNSFSVKILDENKNDVTDIYYIRKTYGTLIIQPREITIKAGDAEKKYDGTPLTCHKFSLESGTLVEGHFLAMPSFVGVQTQIGRSDNIVSDVSVLNSYGVDVTHNYIIKYTIGNLTITD